MQQTDQYTGQGFGQRLVGGGGIGQVQRFTLFDQRAYPVHLPPLRHLVGDTFNHLVAAAVGHEFGDDGCTAGG